MRKREKRKRSKLYVCKSVSFLENKNGEIQQQIDRQKLSSRRKFLLIHGIEEGRHKVTDELVIQTIKSEMDIDIDVKDIDQTCWIGAKTENKRQLIIVKFTRYLERCKLFNSK